MDTGYISLQIPKGVPFQLNTSSFKATIPLVRKHKPIYAPLIIVILLKLYSKYPNMQIMLGLLTEKPPTLVITPQGAKFTLPGGVNVYVVNSTTKASISAFTLGVVSQCEC